MHNAEHTKVKIYQIVYNHIFNYTHKGSLLKQSSFFELCPLSNF